MRPPTTELDAPNSPDRRLDAAPPDVRWVLRQLLDWEARGLRRLGGRKDGEPVRELHLELTHRCNLRCGMCHHWEMPAKDPASVHREMDLEGIRRLAASPLLDGVRRVVVTGGEPMLHAQFEEIVECLARRFPEAELTVLTNLWNTEFVRRKVGALTARGVRRLALGSSLDGLGSAHDEMRGQAGAFEGLAATVAMLRAEFPGLPYGFNFTATPRNHRELWPSYRWAVEEADGWFSAQLVVDHQGLEAPESYRWEAGQLAEVARQIDLIAADLCRRHKALERLVRGEEAEAAWLWERLLYWWRLGEYALRPRRFFKDCLAGQRFAMLDPEGNVFFCPVNKHRRIGNVRTEPLEVLWASRRAEEERGYVDSCRCDCWLNCVGTPILERLIRIGASER